MAYHVLHPIGDVYGEIGGGSAEAPAGDVAEGGVVGDHAIDALEEVLHAFLRLRGEELEGEHRPTISLRRRTYLVNHLHRRSSSSTLLPGCRRRSIASFILYTHELKFSLRVRVRVSVTHQPKTNHQRLLRRMDSV